MRREPLVERLRQGDGHQDLALVEISCAGKVARLAGLDQPIEKPDIDIVRAGHKLHRLEIALDADGRSLIGRTTRRMAAKAWRKLLRAWASPRSAQNASQSACLRMPLSPARASAASRSAVLRVGSRSGSPVADLSSIPPKMRMRTTYSQASSVRERK